MYPNRRILVTGGTGFIGSHVVNALLARGALVRTVVHSRPLLDRVENVEIVRGDLTQRETCIEACRDVDYVFHVAADTTSIVRNRREPGDLMTKNLLMNCMLLEAAAREGVRRYLYTSCVCAYPRDIRLFSEDRCWDGPPEETNLHFGWVKRIAELQAQAYTQQYGMKIAIVRPANTYGPADVSDHAIPSLIRRAIRREDPFVIWGDGSATRDLIFVTDVAEGLLSVLEKYAVADPINLGSGKLVSINQIARLILKLSGHDRAKIVYDTTKPVGQRQRLMDTRKAAERIGFATKIPLEEGLSATIRWWQERESNSA